MTVNPFEYQRIITGKSFVDREKELNELKESLRSKENRIIYSPRRLGKSSLIKELFRLIGNEYITIYVDLWDCFSEADIAEKLLRAAITASYNRIEKAAVAFKEWLTSVRPFFSIGSDGTIDVKIDLIDKEMFLGEAIALLRKEKRLLWPSMSSRK
jgi:AAA+ ATPase superfamily predicted ATPase